MSPRNIVKKLSLIFVASFILGGLSFQLSSASAREEITVGVILPLSGPLAATGRTCKQALDLATKEVNREGGIKSLGGAQIKLVYTDSRGDPKIGRSEAERLILKENVSVILGSFQSSVTMTSTQVAERYKVPYLTIIAVADSITDRGFKYVFRLNEKASWVSRDIIRFFAEMGKLTGKPIKTLGLLYENTEYGQSTAKSWKEYAKEYGFQVQLDEPYPHQTTDVTPVILKFKNANPDAVLTVSYISDQILITKTLAENKWRPKVFFAAGGSETQPEFLKAVGDLAEHHFNIIAYSPDLLLMKPWAKKMVEEYEKEYGEQFPGDASTSYVTLYVLADALERAGSKDREKIREALAKTSITSGRALLLPYQKIEFGPDGQNPHVRLLVCQYQNGKLRIVYPPDTVPPGVKGVWPAPPWGAK